MALDRTGMTLTAAERSDEAARILKRIQPEVERVGYCLLNVNAAEFLQDMFRERALFPDVAVTVSPKQLLWLREIGEKY